MTRRRWQLLGIAAWIGAAAYLVAIAFLLPGPAAAGPVLLGLRWSPPVVHLVDATRDPGWARAFQEAIAEWGPSGLVATYSTGSCSPAATTVVVCEGPLPAGDTALTEISNRGALFAGVTITIQPEASSSRLLEIACHEWGHALGFGHEAMGCMNPVVDGATAPTAQDLDALRSIYPPSSPVPPVPSPRPLPPPAVLPRATPSRSPRSCFA